MKRIQDFSSVYGLLDAWFPQRPKKVAVALSGGVDSMALTYILQQWAKGSVTIVPLIVDHGLRSESNQEAQSVAQMVRDWGLDPVILPWKHPHITTGLMERARYGRYAALAMACHHRDIEHLFVAHHQDDVLETVCMRQEMNGPEYGLAGMSVLTMRYGIMILRPLLCIPKSTLVQAMQDLSVSWVNDSTNRNLQFHRSRARQAIEKWSMDKKNCAITTIQMRSEKRYAHEQVLRRLTPVTHGFGYVFVHNFSPLQALSVCDGAVWIQSWVHSFTFRSVAGLAGQHRLWRVLQDVFSCPSKGPAGSVVATFGGCLFVRHHQQLWIFREHAHIADQSIDCSTQFWDDRIFSLIPYRVQRPPWSKKGLWINRFSRISLPQPWDSSCLTYRPCSWPYPHFMTIQEPGAVQKLMDQGRVLIRAPTDVVQ